MSDEKAIKDFVEKRDALLLEGDLDKIEDFLVGLGHKRASSKNVTEITLHKCRVAVETLPQEMREASREWLKARGYREF